MTSANIDLARAYFQAVQNGDMVAARIHFTGRRGDTSMAMDGVDLLRIQNGKITEMWLFSGDQSAEDAFWGR